MNEINTYAGTLILKHRPSTTKITRADHGSDETPYNSFILTILGL
jgi:hypothetical protein